MSEEDLDKFQNILDNLKSEINQEYEEMEILVRKIEVEMKDVELFDRELDLSSEKMSKKFSNYSIFFSEIEFNLFSNMLISWIIIYLYGLNGIPYAIIIGFIVSLAKKFYLVDKIMNFIYSSKY